MCLLLQYLLVLLKFVNFYQLEQLIEYYYDIRAGIGTHKTPENYGAYPFDPYSHTPGNAGAQQPGMTGQVKEDILSRFGELGIFVEAGTIVFRPQLLRRDEFLTEPTTFTYFDLDGKEKKQALPVGTLAFTYGQTLVTYQLSGSTGIKLHLADGQTVETSSLEMSREWSDSLLNRSGEIVQVEVHLEAANLLG